LTGGSSCDIIELILNQGIMQTKRKPNKNSNSDHLFEGLKFVSYCPLCHSHFSPSEARLVDGNDDTRLLHVVCRVCSSSIVFLLLVGEVGISSVGLVTDLTSKDVLRFKDMHEITADDVLDVHNLLQSSNLL